MRWFFILSTPDGRNIGCLIISIFNSWKVPGPGQSELKETCAGQFSVLSIPKRLLLDCHEKLEVAKCAEGDQVKAR